MLVRHSTHNALDAWRLAGMRDLNRSFTIWRHRAANSRRAASEGDANMFARDAITITEGVTYARLAEILQAQNRRNRRNRRPRWGLPRRLGTGGGLAPVARVTARSPESGACHW